jgi:amino acid transporter
MTAGTAPTARVVWAMAKGKDGDTAEHRYLPFFFSWSYVASDDSLVPIGGIIFCGITSVLLAALPFSFLIQLYLIIRLVNLVSEYCALIYLRFSEPNTPRPYKIPGGMHASWNGEMTLPGVAGPILIFLPTLCLGGLALSFAQTEVLLSGFGTLIGVILCYIFKRVWVNLTTRYGCCRPSDQPFAPEASKQRSIQL